MNTTEFSGKQDKEILKKECKNSHENLLNILDGVEAVVYAADMETYEILFANRYLKDIFGECTGKICWQTLQSGQPRPCDFCTNSRLLKTDGSPAGIISWEYKNTRNNRWYSVHDQAIHWMDGKIVRLEVAIDITGRKAIEAELRKSAELLEKRVTERTAELTKANELLEKEIEYRKRAEESLQESETNFRNIIFSNVDGIVLADKIGIVRFINPAAKALFGKKADQLTDNPFAFPVVPGETKEIDIVVDNNEIRKTEMRVVETVWKSEIHYLILLRNITEQKNMEKELLWQAEINESVAKLSGALLSMVSFHEISFLVLEHAKSMTRSKFGYVGYIDEKTGYLISPTLTRDIWNECQVADKNFVFKEFKGLWGWVLKNKEVLMTNNPEKDHRSTGVPEGHFPVNRFLSVPAIIGEKLVGQISLCNSERDYNEKDIIVIKRIAQLYALAIQRIRTEIELKNAKDAAELASRAKSEFLTDMSHEVRTPMNAVLGMTEVTLSTDLTSEQRENLNIVRDSGLNLLSILNDILDLSKIEAGRFELSKEDIELAGITDSVLRMFSFQAKEKGIKLSCSFDSDVPKYVKGDPIRLRQILVNLIGNAVKFTSKGGAEMAVSVKDRQIQDSYSSSHPDTNIEILFCIRDTGCGIPKEKINLIFENFTQGNGFPVRKYSGTGLGLSISRRIVKMMGGDIHVESEAGKGSAFSFSAIFERAEGKKNTSPEYKPEYKEPGNISSEIGKSVIRILLAEDNMMNQRLAQILLNKIGFQADIAGNGKEAVMFLEKTHYDLVLMDVQMPEMDGLEATRIIRDPESKVLNHEIPVIAMTANVMKGDRERYLDAGMNDYISKPLNMQDIKTAIQKQISEKEKHL